MTRRKKRVQNNARTTGKKLGGVTGKGFRPGTSGNPGGRPKDLVTRDKRSKKVGDSLQFPLQ
jgi:hypothetical protein